MNKNPQPLAFYLANTLIGACNDEEHSFTPDVRFGLAIPLNHTKPHRFLAVLAWIFRVLNVTCATILHLSSNKRRKYPVLWDVSIEIPSNSRYVRRNAAALIDTGCPIDLMSRDFAQMLGDPFENFEDADNVTLETLAGTEFSSIGRVAGRWCCFDKPFSSWFNLPQKYMDSVWYVCKVPAGFDIIIGSETINKYRLLERVVLAAPAGVRVPHKADQGTEAARKQQEKDREENLKEEREDRERKSHEEEQRKEQVQNTA